jgi:hypothetical protein
VKKTKLQYEKEKKYFQDNVNHHEGQVNEAAIFFPGKATCYFVFIAAKDALKPD